MFNVLSKRTSEPGKATVPSWGPSGSANSYVQAPGGAAGLEIGARSCSGVRFG